MDSTYQPQALEKALQARWRREQAFSAHETASGEKFYCLSMFPYPSGKLHMGHVRNYTIGDAISRFQRLLGKNVLQPMGWDAFGLPAENAALKHGVAPSAWTTQNIAHMRKQLQSLGLAVDWQREIQTCDPSYYRHEQWFFLKLYEKGLVYQKTAEVNWDPVDQTVLANEQVIDGRGWRSGALVEKKQIRQWFIKITAYADELLNDLNTLEDWPEAVKKMQEAWLGRSEGVELDFALTTPVADLKALRVYTTRPDTLFGVSYLAIAADHPLATLAATENAELTALMAECRQGSTAEADVATQEKKGLATGFTVIHPLTQEQLPVFVANFVLSSYGTGAVMAVPAHDSRDFAFAEKYQLPIRAVVFPENNDHDFKAEAYTGIGVLKHSAQWTGMPSPAAKKAIAEHLEQQGIGRQKVQYRLRDWGISRQRYWGAPIPMIYCDNCGIIPVPEADLPVVLPTDVVLASPRSPLHTREDFLSVQCPQCGALARRETDTFDTFFESSWYYARFACPDAETMTDDRAHYWLPVDQYIGGIEHAVLHLLYARFFHKAMRDLNLVPGDEPFSRLLTQGMVVAPTFYREDSAGHKNYFSASEVEYAFVHAKGGREVEPVLLTDGLAVRKGANEKMSKSKNNGVDPEPLIAEYGADTLRLFMLFTSPPEQSLEWSDSAIEGAQRFLKRLWRAVYQHWQNGVVTARNSGSNGENRANLSKAGKALRRKLHQTIAKVEQDYRERYAFNTAIAACMELLNAAQEYEEENAYAQRLRQEVFETLAVLLSPIVPHLTQALWEGLGQSGLIIHAGFPPVDQAALLAEEITLVIQINGKLRDEFTIPLDWDAEKIKAEALKLAKVQKHLQGQAPKKIIYVPGKLLNIVA